MRTILTTLILVAATMPALAASGACYNIADADARAYCLARERREVSYCYNIQRADMRSLCMGEVRK